TANTYNSHKNITLQKITGCKQSSYSIVLIRNTKLCATTINYEKRKQASRSHPQWAKERGDPPYCYCCNFPAHDVPSGWFESEANVADGRCHRYRRGHCGGCGHFPHP